MAVAKQVNPRRGDWTVVFAAVDRHEGLLYAVNACIENPEATVMSSVHAKDHAAPPAFAENKACFPRLSAWSTVSAITTVRTWSAHRSFDTAGHWPCRWPQSCVMDAP